MKRFTITFSEEFERRLIELATVEGITKATVIRNSVALYSFLENELQKGGRKLSITDPDDKVIKEIVLPAMLRAEKNSSRKHNAERSELAYAQEYAG